MADNLGNLVILKNKRHHKQKHFISYNIITLKLYTLYSIVYGTTWTLSTLI